MKKNAFFAGLGDYYLPSANGFDQLPYPLTNIDQLMTRLARTGWTNQLPLKEKDASKTNIVKMLTDQINISAPDDWLLFYFAGHAAQYPMPPDAGPDKTFCVTYEPDLVAGSWPPLNTFFSVDDYAQIVSLFERKVPAGHLIAIFDCCYAYGLLNDYDIQKDFQTVIASSAAGIPTYYTDTSFFFKAFSQKWDSTFGTLGNDIAAVAQAQRLNVASIVNPASKFINQKL